MDASSWFTDSVTVESPTGLAASGSRELQWGNRRTVRCKYTAGERMIIGPTGDMVPIVGTIRCTDSITVRDRIWPPGTNTNDPSAARRVLLADPVSNKGNAYTILRVELGR